MLAQLEREALKSQDYDLLIESLRLRLGLNEVSAESIRQHQFSRRSRDVGYLAYKLGWLLERLAESDDNRSNLESAFEAYILANQCLSSESFVLLRIVSLARKLEAYEHVRNALRQLAARSSEPTEASSLWYQSGLVALHLEGNPEEAQRELRRAVELSPTFTPALAKLGEIALQNDDVEGLRRCFSDEIETLERQLQEVEIEVTEGEERGIMRSYLRHTLIRRCYQYGRLLTELGDVDIALTYHLKAISLNPDFSPSLIALEEIYEQRGRWRRLITMYQRRLDLLREIEDQANADEVNSDEASEDENLASNSRSPAVRLAIADLLSAYVNDPLKANRLYAHVATFDHPSHLYALRRASETYQQVGELSSAVIIEQRRAKLYRVETGHDQGTLLYVASLQEFVDESSAPKTSTTGVLTGDVQALSTYQQLWQNAHQPAAFDGMWRCIIRSGQIDGLNYYLAPRTLCHLGSEMLVYQAIEALMSSSQLGRAVELLEIWKERLDEIEVELSIDSEAEINELTRWVRSVSLGADDESSDELHSEFTWEDYQRRDQAENLIERLVHDGDWMGAIQALMRLAQLASPFEQAPLWYRIGFYTEIGIGDTNVARGHYRRALRLNPDYHMALAALRRHSLLQGEWNEYVDYSHKLVRLDRSISTQEAIYTHLGDLNLWVLNEEMVALDFYQRSLELSPAHPLAEASSEEGQSRELYSMPNALRQRLCDPVSTRRLARASERTRRLPSSAKHCWAGRSVLTGSHGSMRLS